jgi:hypothetical protein
MPAVFDEEAPVDDTDNDWYVIAVLGQIGVEIGIVGLFGSVSTATTPT